MSLLNSITNSFTEVTESNEIMSITFNQDYTSLAVGTKTGYRLYTINSLEKLEEIYSCNAEDICIVERLFSSSLVTIVSAKSPKKLRIFHFKKGTEICNYCYSNVILSVKMNRHRLIVCLEERIDIHNIRDMRVIHTIRDTPPNSKGVCALSIDNDKGYLAYPGNSQTGEVQIFDTINLKGVCMIPAHDSPIAALSFDFTGSKLATASEKGTVIRVFGIPNGKRLYEFRRGVIRNATIYSMNFSQDSNYLTVSSNLETIHIFRLDYEREKIINDTSTWSNYFNRALQTAVNYLPINASEVLSQDRAFATVHLPQATINFKNICALTTIQRKFVLLLASNNGSFYIYEVDTENGGECKLISEAGTFYPIVRKASTHKLDTTQDMLFDEILSDDEINSFVATDS